MSPSLVCVKGGLKGTAQGAPVLFRTLHTGGSALARLDGPRSAQAQPPGEVLRNAKVKVQKSKVK